MSAAARTLAVVPRSCLMMSGCRGPVPRDAPVPLCEWHLAVASEWEQRRHGVTDVLPSPCALCGSRLGVRYPSGWLCAVCEWRHGDLVDHELPPPRVDVVYYVRYDDRIKIGTSASPRQRLTAVWHDELLAFERGGRAVEQERHRRFAHLREGGEWFRADDELLEHVRTISAGASPWDAYARWLSEELRR